MAGCPEGSCGFQPALMAIGTVAGISACLDVSRPDVSSDAPLGADAAGIDAPDIDTGSPDSAVDSPVDASTTAGPWTARIAARGATKHTMQLCAHLPRRPNPVASFDRDAL